ncbi:hypothetical protein AVEN_242222-1 [Araneus ventricosus]|uniref:Uncharacterized protein n=1 Tax=Araneus ventricosus TaxID=182803 RepID=A0A4Y2FUJ3_ARAVE|nr:hypothetical protein AVEN_242222-1 [Araneus ventricosus]
MFFSVHLLKHGEEKKTLLQKSSGESSPTRRIMEKDALFSNITEKTARRHILSDDDEHEPEYRQFSFIVRGILLLNQGARLEEAPDKMNTMPENFESSFVVRGVALFNQDTRLKGKPIIKTAMPENISFRFERIRSVHSIEWVNPECYFSKNCLFQHVKEKIFYIIGTQISSLPDET